MSLKMKLTIFTFVVTPYHAGSEYFGRVIIDGGYGLEDRGIVVRFSEEARDIDSVLRGLPRFLING
jgi:hypothetical protein